MHVQIAEVGIAFRVWRDIHATIHNRMPAILEPGHYETWLDHERWDQEAVQSLLKPFPAGRMFAHPVTTRVNSPANDDPACIEPKADE